MDYTIFFRTPQPKTDAVLPGPEGEKQECAGKTENYYSRNGGDGPFVPKWNCKDRSLVP